MASNGSRTLTNEEFLELVQNLSKGNRADKIGYVGNIGINPVFNQNMANLRSMKNAIEEELSDIEINLNGALIRDELELVTDELNDLNTYINIENFLIISPTIPKFPKPITPKRIKNKPSNSFVY